MMDTNGFSRARASDQPAIAWNDLHAPMQTASLDPAPSPAETPIPGSAASSDAVHAGEVTPPPVAAAQQTNSAPAWTDLTKYPGSYYYKELSPLDKWTGIDTTVTLGTPVADPARADKHILNGSKDSFSIYVGCKDGSHIIDAGLSWDVSVGANGKPDNKHLVWRPFWRSDHQWHNAPARSQFYWKPGDTVNMSLSMIGNNRMRLTISDPGPNPKHRFVQDFNATGFRSGDDVTFRRVISIDQSGREGKHVVPTSARLLHSQWVRGDLNKQLSNGQTSEVSLAPPVVRTVEAPSAEHFSVHKDGRTGAETVDVGGGKKQ